MRESKLRRVLHSLENSGINVEYSDQLTRFVCITNSGVICGMRSDYLLDRLQKYGKVLQFMPVHQKSYTFVAYDSLATACTCKAVFDGKRLFKNGPKMNVFCIKEFPEINNKSNIAIPADLSIIEDFIDENDEKQLLEFLKSLFYQDLKNRSVTHFGYKFDYDQNNAYEKADPIPPQIQKIISKLSDFFIDGPSDQITINYYSKGQGIPMHVDTHSAFEEPIASLSLNSSVNIEFKHSANAAQTYEVHLPRRSLMVMLGQSRYCFKHAIRQRATDINPYNGIIETREDRYSITFRKVRQEKCQCSYPEYCDWDRGILSIPSSEKQAKVVEKVYVQGVYEEIADHFDFTRWAKWKVVAEFLQLLPSYSFIVDAGCGNGKYLNDPGDKCFVGFDTCNNLLKAAKTKGEVYVGSILNIPMKANSVDAVISIAVIHHFSTQSRRIAAIKEIARILRPSGRACITVWAFNQKEDGEESIYAKMRAARISEGINQPIIAEQLPIHDGTVFTQKDMLVPWQKADEPPSFRYYHLFDRYELDDIVNSIPGLRIINSLYEQGNYVVIFEKQI